MFRQMGFKKKRKEVATALSPHGTTQPPPCFSKVAAATLQINCFLIRFATLSGKATNDKLNISCHLLATTKATQKPFKAAVSK